MHTPHMPDALSCPAPGRHCRGFTFIELLVVMAITAVLLAAGVSFMRGVGDSMKLTTFSTMLASQLQLARSEALKRNGRVVLCKSASGTECESTGGWHQGWILFHDANNNGLRDPQEALIRRAEALPPGYLLVGNQNVARYVSYSPLGQARMISGSFQAGTITLCKLSTDKAQARQVIISAVGRPRVARTQLNSCY